ncbi:MAG TPA: hypothetical protein VFH07_04680 [Chitinophagaceae bacterium]|nr:hypothetical protein [Chitinophagaceae bacterium]
MKNYFFMTLFPEKSRHGCLRLHLGEVAVFENRQQVTVAKLIKSSLFILLLGFIRLAKLKLISEQKAEDTPWLLVVLWFGCSTIFQ